MSSSSIPVSNDENSPVKQPAVKVSNNTGKVTGYRVKDFQYSTIGKVILNRLLNDRDIKMLITSRGNTTGTGKTQLAIIMSKLISKYAQEIHGNNYNWNAEEYSFLDVYEYLQKYKNAQKGEVLITDELEFLADKRRSLSHGNVHFSQAWQMLRYKNVITIATAPSFANLDMRIAENTDIWINIMYPGFANDYYITMDDFTGEIKYTRLKQMGFRENVRWEPIDDDPDYQILSQKKKDVGIPGMGEDEENLDEEDLDKARNKTKKQLTEDFTLNLLKMKDSGEIRLTQEEIANLVDRSQQYVSKVKREAS